MVIPVGYAQVNLGYTSSVYINGAENVFGVENTTGLTPTQIANDVLNEWVTNLKGLVNVGVTLASIKVKLGPNSTGLDATILPNQAGSSTGDLVPGQVAALVRKLTGVGGRKGRGRLYAPGVVREWFTGIPGQLTPDVIADLLEGYEGFLGGLTTSDTPMVLLHGDSTTPTPVTGVAVEAFVATQRRRIRK